MAVLFYNHFRRLTPYLSPIRPLFVYLGADERSRDWLP